MQTKEFHWTNDDGTRIYAVEWPVEQPRAVMGLIHGVGEHVHRYDELATFFQEKGVAVVGYDRQGFGRSGGKQGHVADYRMYVDEIARLLVQCESRYPDLPAFLYGHSMGGQLLLRYLTRRNPDISGAIVSAPHIRLPKEPGSLLIGFARLMRGVYPAYTQSNSIDSTTLSRNPQVAKDYASDPHVHDLISSQVGLDMLDTAAVLNTYRDGMKIPTLLMHGDADLVTSYEGSRDFARRNPHKLTFKTWPGFYHELQNEPERHQVFQYVLKWMEERMGAVHRRPESI